MTGSSSPQPTLRLPCCPPPTEPSLRNWTSWRLLSGTHRSPTFQITI